MADITSMYLNGRAIRMPRPSNSATTSKRTEFVFEDEPRSGSAGVLRGVAFDLDDDFDDIGSTKSSKKDKGAKYAKSRLITRGKDVTGRPKEIQKTIANKQDCPHIDKLEQRINSAKVTHLSKVEEQINKFNGVNDKRVMFYDNGYGKITDNRKLASSILPQILYGRSQDHPLRSFAKHKVLVFAELFNVSKKADLGGHMVSSKAGDFQEEHERELMRAVDDSEERATRELKAALKRLRDDKEDDKNKALRNQKDYYEKLARRIEEQRNRAEEERERELTKKFMKQQEDALDRQWQECEVIKQEAIAAACEELTRKLRIDFNLEKEQAVAEALRIAKEKYLIRERNVIEKTRRECEEEARAEAARVAKLHQQEIDRCNQRYDLLEKKWLREKDHRKHVEQDFRALQEDYRRFMDYTDGMFHSDYLMQLRHLGQKLAEKQLTTVTYDDLEKEYDLT